MSISMGLMGAEGQFVRYEPYPAGSRRLRIYQLQCRSCGYESPDAVVPPESCPKCGARSWERIVMPGMIFRNAERYPD